MGVTGDLIPRLPGESPQEAIDRVYDGGAAIVLDDDGSPRLEEVSTRPVPAPEAAFDEWRAEVLRRLYDLFPDWSRKEVDGHPHLWTAGFRWQIEINEDDITLRFREGTDPRAPGPDDASFLDIFEGLHTVLYWPDDGEYRDLDDPSQRPDPLDSHW